MLESFDFLRKSAPKAAERLLGCQLEAEVNGQRAAVRIVETEAYDQTDAASHSYNGRTKRTDIMFAPAGHLYVYFTYGMHYCCNIVVGEEGYGAAVLIRAVEPVEGEDELIKNRDGKGGVEITNGPAKLCQALGINKRMNGHDLSKKPLRLLPLPALVEKDIITTTRVGISKAKDVKWRFYIRGNSYISKK
ncbi:MAG TPA: DNA-3-methyladenine glycosylase [Candidatus Saccharimonadales bacterium]|nr:DNA-3-methyladenine glycosylase [Candidatus Saccharimonadales bacterium]